MRKYLNIDLQKRSSTAEVLQGDALAKAGRYLIAKTLLEAGVAKVDALAPANPLIFSAGPLAGTSVTNANRISVGCKSPLTGGIKEANSGGTFAVALGQLSLAGFTLNGAASDWVVIRITKGGAIGFDSAAPYLGKGNFEAAALLRQAYGDKVSLALCGPVGEYLGLMAGIAFTDREGRPGRLAARGGVGAVMGAKKVKAIVVDFDKMPPLHDKKKLYASAKIYAQKLNEQPAVKVLREQGTAFMGDLTNYMGGLPVRNFSSGRLVERGVAPFEAGGEAIRERNMKRGGHPSHACMPGCVIQCSNVYVDEAGKELVSPLEYETIGLMGTNCGLTDPDDMARLNHGANDLGVDSIELGATLGVLMEAGQLDFGDARGMAAAIEDIRKGNERGRLLAQGTSRVGAHYRVKRVPAIKGQAISAYDPRVIEVTGISMMTTAQGADHTTGNVALFEAAGKPDSELVAASYNQQVNCAIADSTGLCVFGRSVTDSNHDLVAELINGAVGTTWDAAALRAMGQETLVMELAFNRAAGFTEADDRLPAFFYDEPLAPTNKVARQPDEINRCMAAALAR